MHDIDHFVAGAIIVISIVQAFADPEILKQAPRLTFFKAGAATGMAMGALVLLLWNASNRPIGDFGLFGWLGPARPLTIAIAVLWPLFLLAVAWLILAPFRAAAARYYSGYSHLMPRNRREMAAAYATGGFAAFGEEIAYRGFLIWYLHAFAGLAAAALASSVVFGIAHGYQGKLGMVFASLAGLVLAAAYIGSGSLLLVLWMHASYNVASFTLGHRLLYSRHDPARVHR